MEKNSNVDSKINLFPNNHLKIEKIINRLNSKNQKPIKNRQK